MTRKAKALIILLALTPLLYGLHRLTGPIQDLSGRWTGDLLMYTVVDDTNSVVAIEELADLTDFVAGTTNQVTVTDDADGTLTLALPQDIATTSSPTFASVTATTSLITPLLDATGAVDLDIGSVDITDVTITTDGGVTIIDGTITALGLDLGSTAAEWNDLFLNDGGKIQLGADQDVTLTHVADTGLQMELDDSIMFGDTAVFIESDDDGYLDLDADTGIRLNANTASTGTITAVGSFIIGSADMSETDLEQLDGITAGTAAASKALVLDGSLDIATINTLTATSLVGALTGNADTVTTNANMTGDVTSVGNATDITETVLGVSGTDTIFPADPGADRFLQWDDDPGELIWAAAAGVGDFLADGSVPMTGSLYLTDAAAASADSEGFGQIWVKNDAPDTLWFTDDDGTDVQLGTSGATAYNAIGDATGAGSISFDAAEGGTYTSADDEWVGITISDTFADNAGDTELLTLAFTDDGDTNSHYLIMSDAAGTQQLEVIQNVADVQITTTGDLKFIAGGGDFNFADDNVTTTGTVQGGTVSDGTMSINAGSLTSVVGVDASGTVSGNLFTPDAADGADIGTAALEFSDIFLADGSIIYGQNDQTNTITSSATDWTFGLDVTITGGDLTVGAAAVMSEVDMEKLDGITNGTAAANKALVLDGSADITTGLNSLTATTFTDGTLTITGGEILDATTLEATTTLGIEIGDTQQLVLTDGKLNPTTDDDIDLGDATHEFKDAFFDGTVTSDAFAGPLTGAVTGNADTATLAATVTYADNENTAETNAVVFLPGGDLDGGNLAPEVDGDFHYTPSTGTVTATEFVGGGVGITGLTVTVSDDEATADNQEIVFTTDNAALESDGDFHYNPSTGTVTATEFSGGGASLTAIDAATGDSATDFFDAGEIVDARISDTLTSSSCTGNAATVTNATLTTALTVDTGTLTLTAAAANNSVLTIGAGGVSVSGANTGDDDVPDAGDFGAGTDLDANGAVTWTNMTEGELTDQVVVSGDIKEGTILVGDMAANSIDSAQYADGSIDHEHLAADVISGMTEITSADADYILVWDATDSALKRVDMGEVRGGSDGTGTDDQTLAEVLAEGADGGDVDQTSLGKLEFFDAGLYIDADADGVMDITSDGTLELHSADWDISATGTLTNTEWQGTAIADAYVPNDITIDLAAAVTNATLTTALTVNTGTLTLTANAANNSVLTIGAGAVSVSGANTGDNTVATSGDAAVDFFGAGVDAVTDTTECTDLEGTGLAITAGVLNWTAASTDLSDTAALLYETELDDFSELQAQISDKTLVNEEDAAEFDSVITFAAIPVITANGLTLGDTGAGDPVITFDSTNDATLTWWEDEKDLILVGGHLTIPGGTAGRLRTPTGQALYLNAVDAAVLAIADTDFIVHLDDDTGGDETFQILDGADNVVLQITEAGAWTVLASSNIDFGGADLELPQGQTPDTDGEVDLDFTDGSVVIQHGSAHGELGAATDVVVGKLIHSNDWTLAFPDLLQAESDNWPLMTVEATEFPHGIYITDIYLKTASMTGYDLNLETWTDPNTVSATIDNITTTIHVTDEATEDTITAAYCPVGSIIMADLPTTDVAWIYIKIEYYEPIATP